MKKNVVILQIKCPALRSPQHHLSDFVHKVRSQGSFARNFTITFSGNTVAILAGLLLTPFIARVYSPEAYGLFAFFVAVTQNFAIVATLQLPRAFVLPEDETEFSRLVRSAVVPLVATVAILLGVFIIWGHRIFAAAGMPAAYTVMLIYLIPVAVFLYALVDIFRSWNVRRKFFGINAVTQVSSSVVSRGTTLMYGILSAGHSAGLVLGDMISKVLEGLYLGRQLFRGRVPAFTLQRTDFFKTLHRYRSYPLFVLPGVWIQAIITQLPVYVALFFFDSAAAGHYSFANSLLNLPVNMLAGSLAPVFLQKASETWRRNPGDMARIVKSMSDKLFFTGLAPMVLLMVFGDYIFRFFLGVQWVSSGRMASYMGAYFLLLVLHFPLVSLYRIYGKEHIGFATTVFSFVLSAIALGVAVLLNDFMLAILLFSGVNVIYYCVNIYVVLGLSGVRPFPTMTRWLSFFAIAVGAAVLLRVTGEYFFL